MSLFTFSIPENEWPDADSWRVAKEDKWCIGPGDRERYYRHLEKERWGTLTAVQRQTERKLYWSLFGELVVSQIVEKQRLAIDWSHKYLTTSFTVV